MVINSKGINCAMTSEDGRHYFPESKNNNTGEEQLEVNVT